MSYYVELFSADKEKLKAALRARQYGSTDARGNVATYGPPVAEVDKVCLWLDRAPTLPADRAFHVKMNGSHHDSGGTENAEMRCVEAV